MWGKKCPPKTVLYQRKNCIKESFYEVDTACQVFDYKKKVCRDSVTFSTKVGIAQVVFYSLNDAYPASIVVQNSLCQQFML